MKVRRLRYIHLFHAALALLGAHCTAWPAMAQPFAIEAPRLVINGPAEMPVSLRTVGIRTEIQGRSAVTEVTFGFFNPNARRLEGELQFPLQEGQVMVGMAMDVGGSLREAVPVDKARGEAVFEDVTRARIDPALLSQTQGNNYKLRVYPIEPRSSKTVVLRYAEWLAPQGAVSRYRLPLAYADRLAALSVSMRVVGVGAAPRITARGFAPARDATAFKASGDGYRFDLERRDVMAGNGMAAAFLQVDLQPLAGGHATTERRDGLTHFIADLPIASLTAPRSLPRSVTIVWDSSGSGSSRDHGREFALLEAYFARSRETDVRLVRVRDAAEPALRFRITGGDWRALHNALEATVYDGATDLGAFVSDTDANDGEVLLFSDGLSNFGRQRFDAGRLRDGSARPVYAVSGAPRADAARLRAIAEGSGGRFIDLLQGTDAAAAAQLLHTPSRVVELMSRTATDLLVASPYAADGALTVAGRFADRTAEILVVVLHPDGRRQMLHLAVDEAMHSGAIAAQAWARLRVAALDAEYDSNRAEIRRIGAAYSIVTRETSLIVLDRAEDYARHEIAPPPDLAAEVKRLRSQAMLESKAGENAQIERVVRLLQMRQAWWLRDFPKTPAPLEVAANKDIAVAGGVMRSGAADERRRDAPSRSEDAAATGRVAATATGTTGPAPILAAPMAEAPRQLAAAPAAARLAKSSDAGGAENATTTVIRLRPAVSDAPYAARLRAASTEQLYRVYLDERARQPMSTAFVLDAADALFERGLTALGVRVLSNLAEMDLENRQVLRILGTRLVQAGRADLAVPVFERVLRLAPNEPQSHRDLGLALAGNGRPQAAIDALYEVVRKPWQRFPEIELIALAELNAIVATNATLLDTSRIDPRLVKNMPLDLRATLSWDADDTDIDLWVTDPNGERAFYGHALTRQGGMVSRDITGGYGPEEFLLRHAIPGKYTVTAQFYGHRQQIVAGATTVQLSLITAFGTMRQQQRSVTLRLKDRQDQVLVGEFEVQPAP